MASERINNTDRFCKLAISDGQLHLYMPDGTKIPDQIDCKFEVEQLLDDAIGRPRICTVTISVIATLVDSVPNGLTNKDSAYKSFVSGLKPVPES